MDSFFQDLWSSIFTPGPTPTLLVATNVTLASLQFLFFLLLLATSSIHFIVLSFLCGALWWSINWFAREFQAAQASASEKEEKTGEESEADLARGRRPPGTIDTSESDTETEADVSSSKAKGTSHSLLKPPEAHGLKMRPNISRENSGYASTDSEWEKIDANSSM